MSTPEGLNSQFQQLPADEKTQPPESVIPFIEDNSAGKEKKRSGIFNTLFLPPRLLLKGLTAMADLDDWALEKFVTKRGQTPSFKEWKINKQQKR